MALRIVTAALVLLIFVMYLSTTHRTVVTAPVPTASTTQAATVINTLIIPTDEFSEIGTLVFYPNNVGPVPYIFYQDASGVTVAKALTFAVLPMTDFSTWSGARVAVTGIVDHEHVVVTRISYLAPP